MFRENDAELIDRWRRGEEAAFAELVSRWQKPVARFLSRFAADAASLEDLCQEVFLRVYLARRRFRAGESFSNWLFQIAVNAARDAHRRNQRRNHPPLGNDQPVDTCQSPAAACGRREAAALTRQALAELPEKLRLPVVLRHYEKMTFPEMSNLLAVPETTLKSRFSLALKRLQTRLRQLGVSPEDDDL